MKAKDYLKQLEDIDLKTKHLLEEVDTMKAMATSISAVSDGERVQASMSGDKIPKIVAKYVDMENKINEQIDGYIDLRHKIIDEIHSMSNTLYMNILFKRYVEFKSLEEIAVDTGYSYQYIRSQHGYALLDFQKIVDKKEKEEHE